MASVNKALLNICVVGVRESWKRCETTDDSAELHQGGDELWCDLAQFHPHDNQNTVFTVSHMGCGFVAVRHFKPSYSFYS